MNDLTIHIALLCYCMFSTTACIGLLIWLSNMMFRHQRNVWDTFTAQNDVNRDMQALLIANSKFIVHQLELNKMFADQLQVNIE